MLVRRSGLAALVVAALMATACGSSGDDAAAGADVLPGVDIERLDGTATISLADIEGPAVINLWATWCAPCRREIPDFEAVHQARGDEIRFVGINIGEDSGRANEFLVDVGATYDQFLDREGYVVTELRTTTMPVTIVLDRNGAIVERHLGPLDQDGLNQAIDNALD